MNIIKCSVVNNALVDVSKCGFLAHYEDILNYDRPKQSLIVTIETYIREEFTRMDTSL